MSCSYDRSSKSKKSSSGSNGSDHVNQDHHRNYEYRCLAKLRTGTAATTSAMTTLSSEAEKGEQEWGKVVEVAGNAQKKKHRCSHVSLMNPSTIWLTHVVLIGRGGGGGGLTPEIGSQGDQATKAGLQVSLFRRV